LTGIKPPTDWRASWHGATIDILAWDRKDTRKNGSDPQRGLVLLPDQPGYPVFCALPRDSDGSWGTEARNRGELALHYRLDESGNYVGEPLYVNEEEFVKIWDHSKNSGYAAAEGAEEAEYEEEEYAEEA
jgi:hypothetical protein